MPKVASKKDMLMLSTIHEDIIVGDLLGPRTVRVSGTAETERASGKPSV